jgi:hypothetical protein
MSYGQRINAPLRSRVALRPLRCVGKVAIASASEHGDEALRAQLEAAKSPVMAALVIAGHGGGPSGYSPYEICLSLEALSRTVEPDEGELPENDEHQIVADTLVALRERLIELIETLQADTIASVMCSLGKLSVCGRHLSEEGVWESLYVALGRRGSTLADEFKPLEMQMFIRGFSQVFIPLTFRLLGILRESRGIAMGRSCIIC